jgi:hypothetical protein
VRVGEEKVQLTLPQLMLQRCLLLLDLLREVGVVRRQVGQLNEVSRPVLQVRPAGDLVAQLAGLTRDGTGRLGVVPDAGLREPPV